MHWSQEATSPISGRHLIPLPEKPVDGDFRVTFLGTSAASIVPLCSTSACLVEVGRTRIMVDAGIGALRQLRRVGVSPDNLDAVLLTHWHPDHFAGLCRLVRARADSAPLLVLGPEPPRPVRLYLRMLCPSAWSSFQPVTNGRSTRISDIDIEPVDTAHRVVSAGWKLDEAYTNRRMVVSGDTRPVGAVLEAARGADLLVHEATFLGQHRGWAVRHGHSTAWEAATLARESGAGALVLTHTSSRYSMEAIGLEAEMVYPEAFVASPLTVVSIGQLPDGATRTGHGWAQLSVQVGEGRQERIARPLFGRGAPVLKAS